MFFAVANFLLLPQEAIDAEDLDTAQIIESEIDALQPGGQAGMSMHYVPNHGDSFCHLINQISCLILFLKDSLRIP